MYHERVLVVERSAQVRRTSFVWCHIYCERSQFGHILETLITGVHKTVDICNRETEETMDVEKEVEGRIRDVILDA